MKTYPLTEDQFNAVLETIGHYQTGSDDYCSWNNDDIREIMDMLYRIKYIVDELKAGSWANAPYEPAYKIPPTELNLKAAKEIETLRDMLREIVDAYDSPEPRIYTNAIERAKEMLK